VGRWRDALPEGGRTRLIDEYELLVQPVLAGHGPTLLAGLRERIQLELVGRHEFRSWAVAARYRPTRAPA